ncbi:MAG: hypothetical protein K6U80_01265 [Firmicutes bacterium]|nr:hypothetical protein [Bacillota bacterium]
MEFSFHHIQALLPAGSTLIIFITVIFFLVKGKKSLLQLSFIAMLLVMSLWTIGQTLQYISGNDLTTWISIIFIYTSINFLDLSWLLFTLVYTNHPMAHNTRKLLLLFSLPFLAWLGLLTNGYHHLFFPLLHYAPDKFSNLVVSYGALFWVSVLIVYCYYIAGFIILYKYSLTQTGQARKQTLFLCLAPLLTFVSAISCDLYLLISKDTSPVVIDITPNLITVTILMFAIAAYRYRFLDILPGALQKIVENINDAVLIIDNTDCIVSFNPAFVNFFHHICPVQTNEHASRFTEALRQYTETNPETALVFAAFESASLELFEGDICLLQPDRKYYKVKIRKIIDKNKLHGRIITFTDVTEYRKLLKEINEKNIELSAINEQLQEHLELVEELAVANERNRLAHDLHDSLGQLMALSISQLEACGNLCEKQPLEAKDKLEKIVRLIREGLAEIRHSITGLIPEKIKKDNLIEALQNLIMNYQDSGLEVDFCVEGAVNSLEPRLVDTVYRTCQEALTNSLKHGQAKQIMILLRFLDDCLKVYISDDGRGCKTIVKGLGLAGMEQRVKSLKGELFYGSDGERGFNIRLKLPLAGKN